MNKPIRFTGYIDHADVLEPIIQIDKNDIFYEKSPIKKYRIFLMASMSDIMPLESEVEHREYEWCLRHSQQGDNNPPESRISYEHGLIFESLYQPQLEGDLRKAASDLELSGKYVQVVGYVQQQELGNCFLSFHIVEPAVHPAELFDL